MTLLDANLRARLLQHARSAISAHLSGIQIADMDQEPWPDLERRGVFVTLRKNGNLRGCIGTFVAHADLPTTVREMAVAAAQDPRFVAMPISSTELPHIRIDISVLSPLQPIDDPLSLTPGRHGIYIRRGHSSGCFLPDVASERNWDAQTFLTQCCLQKAGLDGMAWKETDTEVFVFTVEKFGDEDI
jgi:AmmeMemoRadiSam system protein A